MQIIVVGPMSVEELGKHLATKATFNEDGATLVEMRLAVEIEVLKAENEKLKGERREGWIGRMEKQRDQLLEAHKDQAGTIRSYQLRIQDLEAEVDNLRSEQGTMNASRDELVKQRDTLQTQLTRAWEAKQIVIDERDALQAQLDSLSQTHDFVRRERDRLQVQHDAMEHAYLDAEKQVRQLRAQLTDADRLADQRLVTIERIGQERDVAQGKQNELSRYKISAETVIRDQANTIAALRAPKP